MSNLSLNLVSSARNHAEHIALRCDDLTYTFAEFDEAAARVATLLEREGIEPGDRVGLMLPNSAAFPLAYYGIMRRGAVAVPMNPLLKSREVEFYLSNTGAKALFASPAFADAATGGAEAVGAKTPVAITEHGQQRDQLVERSGQVQDQVIVAQAVASR